jgi:hypothetical protein
MTVIRRGPGAISWPAVVVSALAAFALSIAWYSPLLFGDVWLRFRSASVDAAPSWKFAIAPLRELVTAAVVAWLLARIRPTGLAGALALALLLWLGFYAVQLSGAVIWDSMPWQLGAVHAGDWLMKIVFMTLALSFWSRRGGVKLSRDASNVKSG